MFYYKDTMQQRALRLMASKLSAATVIEGNISEEGLAAMSDCEDLTTQLAKELMTGLKENVDTLADSFKKMAILGNHEQKANEELPPTLIIEAETPELESPTIPAVIFPIQPTTQTPKANGKNHDTGQLSLFDLVA